MRIDEGILRQADRRPNKIALRMGGEMLTYGALRDRIQDIARALVDDGYRPGNKMAICLENSMNYIPLFLGAVHAGMVACPINPRLTEEEKESILSSLGPHVMLEERDGEIAWNRLEGVDTVEDGDVFYIGCSSGTTGRPKGIRRKHASWVDSFYAMSEEFRMDENTAILIPGPLCYSASLIAALHVLFIGGTVELHRRFHPEQVLQAFTSSEVTATFMVPTMYRDVMTCGGHEPLTDRPLIFVTAGDKMPHSAKTEIQTLFPNAQLYEYYGTSEVGFVSVLKPGEERRKPDSVGRPFSGAQVKCVNGEIWVKSTMGFCGYDGEDQAVNLEKVHRGDGWLATTDLGWLDEEGYLYVSGRQQEKMVSGGINIYPREIETILERHPEVLEAAVFAFPDDRLTEVPVAAIVWRSQVPDDFNTYIKSSITGYKRPAFWFSMPKLPRNVAGKVQKAQLRAECESIWRGHAR